MSESISTRIFDRNNARAGARRNWRRRAWPGRRRRHHQRSVPPGSGSVSSRGAAVATVMCGSRMTAIDAMTPASALMRSSVTTFARRRLTASATRPSRSSMAKGLHQVLKGAAFHCGRHRLGANHTTGQNHIQARIDRLDLGQHLQAVDPWHEHVEQHAVDSLRTNDIERVRTVGCRQYLRIFAGPSRSSPRLPRRRRRRARSGGSQPASAEQF